MANMTIASNWFTWALFSAVFAALTAIFAKIGLSSIYPSQRIAHCHRQREENQKSKTRRQQRLPPDARSGKLLTEVTLKVDGERRHRGKGTESQAKNQRKLDGHGPYAQPTTFLGAPTTPYSTGVLM